MSRDEPHLSIHGGRALSTREHCRTLPAAAAVAHLLGSSMSLISASYRCANISCRSSITGSALTRAASGRIALSSPIRQTRGGSLPLQPSAAGFVGASTAARLLSNKRTLTTVSIAAMGSNAPAESPSWKNDDGSVDWDAFASAAGCSTEFTQVRIHCMHVRKNDAALA